METTILPAGDEASRTRALDLLGEGGLVALPTETVYGLAADSTNGSAVARIFEAKGRPSFNPLIAHVADRAMGEAHARFDDVAAALAERFWPGPLTLVLPARPGSAIHPLVRAGLDTLGLRMPRGVMGEIARDFGRPLAAPSANRSGRVSPTSADHVRDGLAGRVELVLDAGPCGLGLESTILKVADGAVALLRPGSLTAEEIETFLGRRLETAGEGIQAPGQMASHYAPAGRVRLQATHVDPGEHLVAFGPAPLRGAEQAASILNLSEAGDLREAAARLFEFLNRLDSPLVERIAVAPIPDEGLGRAINDRLRRAAAPR